MRQPTPGALTAGQVMRSALAGQPGRLTGGSALLMLWQMGEAAVPAVVGMVVDQAIAPGDVRMLLVTLTLLAGVFLALMLGFRSADRTLSRAIETSEHELRLRVAARAVAPAGGVDTVLPGSMLSLATQDAKQVAYLANGVAIGLASLAGIAVAGVALFLASPRLGLVIAAMLPPILVIQRLVARPLERRGTAEQEANAVASGAATDLVLGLRVLKGLGGERAAAARYRTVSRELLDATVAAERFAAMHQGFTGILNGLLLATVALVGARMAVAGTISVGQLVSAVGLAQYLIAPLLRLSYVFAIVARARASAVRVAGLLSMPPAVVERGAAGASAAEHVGGVTFDGVAHGPLRDVSLEIAPGAMVGIAAVDVADADTVVALLGRLVDPDAGRLLLDDTPFGAFGLDDLRRTVVVSPHDAELFDGMLDDSVRELAANDRAVEPALRAAGADEVVASTPGGLATLLGERGRTLSGGQRQRVALARVLAADAPVLVLHEPTTAVDSVTESAIAQGLHSLRAGRTTVVVTTSPVLLAAMDEVVLIAGGAVVARGSHAALAASHAGYRQAVLS